jgi:hypothetical protein
VRTVAGRPQMLPVVKALRTAGQLLEQERPRPPTADPEGSCQLPPPAQQHRIKPFAKPPGQAMLCNAMPLRCITHWADTQLMVNSLERREWQQQHLDVISSVASSDPVAMHSRSQPRLHSSRTHHRLATGIKEHKLWDAFDSKLYHFRGPLWVVDVQH